MFAVASTDPKNASLLINGGLPLTARDKEAVTHNLTRPFGCMGGDNAKPFPYV